MSFNVKTIRKIEKLREEGHHTKAYLAGAQMLGDKFLAADLQELMTDLEPSLEVFSVLQNGLHRQLLAAGKRRLTSEQAEIFQRVLSQ